MISRRIVRVKVMQVLFAHQMSGDKSAVNLDSILSSRIEKIEQLYFVYLQYLVDICQYAIIDASQRASRFILKEGDSDVNTDISRNSCMQTILESPSFKNKQAIHSTSGFIDKKIVKDLFKKLQATEKYVKYCEIQEKTKEDDALILRYIIKKIIGASETLDENLSEHFMNLEDDHFITLHSIQKKLKDYFEHNTEDFLTSFLLNESDDEVIEFSKDLLNKTLTEDVELEAIIKPRLKNWDLERIALMDILLIKLAIMEFLYFPYIPLKVSLNEYIDISKEYSTDKSKDFINGVLDKVMKNLKENGKIKKLGRGLINN